MENVGGRRGGCRHAAIEFHSFPLHDNDTEFPGDLMYEIDYSQDSDCSEDSDSSIGKQVSVDYSDLELLHHHRRGYEAHSHHTLRGINGGVANVGSCAAAVGGSGAAQGGCLGGAQGRVFVNSQQLDGMPAGSGPGSGRRSGPATRGRVGGSCRRGPVRVYTNPGNLGMTRSGRHQWREESSLRDQAHDLLHDFPGTDFHSDPASSRRLQQNSRVRNTGLESQRVSS